MKRVLILIHFASKLTRDNMAATGLKVVPAVRASVDNFEAVFSSEIAFGFVGVTSKSCDTLLKELVRAIGLKNGDNISVVEAAEVIVSTHPGLAQWQTATQMVSVLARSDRPK
jgi:hypothetical protein